MQIIAFILAVFLLMGAFDYLDRTIKKKTAGKLEKDFYYALRAYILSLARYSGNDTVVRQRRITVFNEIGLIIKASDKPCPWKEHVSSTWPSVFEKLVHEAEVSIEAKWRKAQEEERRHQEERGRQESGYQGFGANSNGGGNQINDAMVLLNLKPGFTSDELKASYHRFVRLYHPDNFADKSSEDIKFANENMSRINNAFELLKGSAKQ